MIIEYAKLENHFKYIAIFHNYLFFVVLYLTFSTSLSLNDPISLTNLLYLFGSTMEYVSTLTQWNLTIMQWKRLAQYNYVELSHIWLSHNASCDDFHIYFIREPSP